MPRVTELTGSVSSEPGPSESAQGNHLQMESQFPQHPTKQNPEIAENYLTSIATYGNISGVQSKQLIHVDTQPSISVSCPGNLCDSFRGTFKNPDYFSKKQMRLNYSQ